MQYYYEIKSINELVGDEGILRIPEYALDEFVLDEKREEALNLAINLLNSGENVLIVGVAGSGKTALMALILKRLLEQGGRIAFILEGANIISREHEREGIILFYDDIPRMKEDALRSIFKNGVKGIIATARVEELPYIERKIGYRFDESFNIIRVPLMSKEKLMEMLKRYVHREAITIADPKAAEIVVEKAQGLPVYVWQVIRELRILKKSLTKEYAQQIPEGMLDYIDDILWRVLDEHPDRYDVLFTLLIMSDLKRYAIHQDLFNYVFLISRERRLKKQLSLEEALFNTLLDRITRYLAREGLFYAFRLPHDSWGDVLKGRSNGPMSGEISRVNTIYPKEKRIKLLEEAIIRAWNETIQFAEESRKHAFIDFIRINFGNEGVKRLLEMKELSKKEKIEIKQPEGIVEELKKVKVPEEMNKINESVALINEFMSTKNVSLLDRALEKLRDLRDPYASYYRGLIYYLKRDYKEALKELNKTAKNLPRARLIIALIKLKENDVVGAKDELDEYIKRTPDDTEAKKVFDMIKSRMKPYYRLLFSKE